MNRTKWNPVTGCWGPGGTAEQPKRCSYCYAAKISKRFLKSSSRGIVTEHFVPTFYSDRLSQPAKVKKPSKIFVCSMGDLFGDWVSDVWICHVLNQIVRPSCSHHTYQFLTKNPKRLKKFNPWPSNCWVGTTVTNQADADERLPWLLQAEAPVRFVSHEPLLGFLDIENWLIRGGRAGRKCPGCGLSYGHDALVNIGRPSPACSAKVDWAIIGAQTGPGAAPPDPAWVPNLIDQYRAAGVPICLKDNLRWPEKIQEWAKP